jgi:predicted acylesterase/phospholipase RssA
MNTQKLWLAMIVLLILPVPDLKSQVFTEKYFVKEPQGTAVIITGAAARIPQEAALLETLYRKGMLNDVVFISGASSGALNTVMLNAILNKKITWKEYKDILYNIKNDSVFRMGERFPIDTNPLRNFLTHVLHNRLGYYRIGELPFPSAISITDIDLLKFSRKNYRLSNFRINPESDPSLDLVEVLMASTAFPVVFPKAKISHAKTLPDHEFVDGGLGDHIPYQALIQFINYRKQSVKRVIIISRKSGTVPELSKELANFGLTDNGVFDKWGISLEDFLASAFIKDLKMLNKDAPELAEKTLVYIPSFEENFLLMNFDNLKTQYETTFKWAGLNPPVPLKQYLESVNRK